ncbi:MAG: hypothetical protein KA214_01975 [Neisseriaceae bacterium]|nr:hypothetical protein [Neisseriaceae bacterium]
MKRLLVTMMIMTGWALAGCVSTVDTAGQAQRLATVKTRLALGYMGQGQGLEAQRQIDAAVRLAPAQPHAWLVRAQIYSHLDRHTEADASYQQALILAPEAGMANHHYGWYLCQTDATRAAAMAYFDRALADEAYADRAQASGHRQACLAQLGQPTE